MLALCPAAPVLQNPGRSRSGYGQDAGGNRRGAAPFVSAAWLLLFLVTAAQAAFVCRAASRAKFQHGILLQGEGSQTLPS